MSSLTLITLAVVPKCTHFLESFFETIVLGWICSVHCWKLHTLKGNGFDCLFTFVSIKMEHPWPLQVCTNACIIFALTGAGVIRVYKNYHLGYVWPALLFFQLVNTVLHRDLAAPHTEFPCRVCSFHPAWHRTQDQSISLSLDKLG